VGVFFFISFGEGLAWFFLRVSEIEIRIIEESDRYDYCDLSGGKLRLLIWRVLKVH
jgi:hypothetical protein